MALVVNAFQGQTLWTRPQRINELPKLLKTKFNPFFDVSAELRVTPLEADIEHPGTPFAPSGKQSGIFWNKIYPCLAQFLRAGS